MIDFWGFYTAMVLLVQFFMEAFSLSEGDIFPLSPFHVDSTAGLAISGAIFGDTADK